MLKAMRTLIERKEFNTEERRILDLLDRGLAREFPNPGRTGCPGPEILGKIAEHSLSLAEADPWLSHLSTCTPCFQDFKQLRRRARTERSPAVLWLAAAAIVLLAIGGWLWVSSRQPAQMATVVVLDLRGRATTRGETPGGANQPPLEIPHRARHLQLDLPVGSHEGTYDLALLNGNGDELLRSTGTARLEDHVVILKADVDLSGISPGFYFLGLRQPGMEWTRFAIRVL